MATETSQTRGHDTVLDVTAEQVAGVYAQAFLKAAGSAGNAEEALAEFKAVLSEVVGQFPRFAEAIRSAFLSHDDRVALIDRVLGGRVTPVVLNTLKVLSAHNRLGLLGTVVRLSAEQFELQQGRVAVSVTTAEPLTSELENEIASALRDKLQFEPVVTSSVEPDMIAGIKIRVGDTVYDGSIRTVFDKARAAMVDQAIARIEQSPDVFLAPADSNE